VRVPVERLSSSARPGRGALVAVLFAVVTVGLVAAFSSVENEESDIEASGSEPEEPPSTSGVDNQTSTSAASTIPGPGEELLESVAKVDLALRSARMGRFATTTAKPTTTTTEVVTTAPPTTRPPTTAPPTTPAPSTDSSSSSETSTPTAPTQTTGHPDGWVDTGNGVFVPPVLLDIRYCESRGNYTAANPSSSARGAYQFLTGSWAAYGHNDRYGVSTADKASPAQQDEAALITWQQSGTTPWNASKHCWG